MKTKKLHEELVSSLVDLMVDEANYSNAKTAIAKSLSGSNDDAIDVIESAAKAAADVLVDHYIKIGKAKRKSLRLDYGEFIVDANSRLDRMVNHK